VITRTFFLSISRSWARRSRVGKGVCVEAQIVALPFLISATAAWGSIGAWAT